MTRTRKEIYVQRSIVAGKAMGLLQRIINRLDQQDPNWSSTYRLLLDLRDKVVDSDLDASLVSANAVETATSVFPVVWPEEWDINAEWKVGPSGPNA